MIKTNKICLSENKSHRIISIQTGDDPEMTFNRARLDSLCAETIQTRHAMIATPPKFSGLLKTARTISV